MMGPLEYKAITSLFGMVVGAMCLWLGYRLYDKGVIEKGQLGASGHGVKLQVKDYGPGVAFAAFGAIIVVFCVTRTFTVTTSNMPGVTTVKTVVGTPVVAASAQPPPIAAVSALPAPAASASAKTAPVAAVTTTTTTAQK